MTFWSTGGVGPQELAGRLVKSVDDAGLAGMPVTTRRVSPAFSRGIDPVHLRGSGHRRVGEDALEGMFRWSLRCFEVLTVTYSPQAIDKVL